MAKSSHSLSFARARHAWPAPRAIEINTVVVHACMPRLIMTAELVVRVAKDGGISREWREIWL